MTAINRLAWRLNVADQWKTDRRTGADLVTTQLDGVHLVLIKPRQFMNVNGTSVANAARKFHRSPENIYLLHEKLDKPLGKVTLKLGASARGHNGVRSCIDHLKSGVSSSADASHPQSLQAWPQGFCNEDYI
ncbi:probable peptidyl-tRNA hydrolase [Bufo gargarizans]|uniref:probable peptidyl-tRNA hydrolase n=1 Tax=Bufo gargarizans TaxID=30331 RepID=UPI001CF1BF9B|nr:probable peptidyl-tRNA hydrolase [Bufo gargarizans]